MLEVFTNFACATILSTGYIIGIKKVISDKSEKFTLKDYVWIAALIIFSAVFYNVEYKIVYSLSIYIFLIIATKKIFKLELSESILMAGLLVCLVFVCEIANSLLYIGFITIEQIRGIWYFKILSNTSLAAFLLLLCSLNKIKKIYKILVLKTKNKNKIVEIIFLVLCIMVFIFLSYNLIKDYGWNQKYLLNISIMIIFFILISILLKEKDNNNKLMSEYDDLFIYVQNFEEWIEKEQLNRHEYKNQLAVLRCLTKENKVKDKIDEILEDSINIEGEVVQQLKALPKGGIKGLMYYKAAIAQKHKINLTVNVSLEIKSILNKLSEKDIRVLCKLIGIYFDNAIEAAKETRKKVILIEIYELTDKVNIVFSNTFKQHKNFHERNKKGVSSKGAGHGNGLYFASKMIMKTDWLEEKQEVIDKYYIQELSIKNKNISTK